MPSSSISLTKRYRMRDGTPIIGLEHVLVSQTPSVKDGFPWRAWYLDPAGRRRFHWYTNFGKWSNIAGKLSQVDLVEIPK